MELFIGIGFVIFGGWLAYHNLKDTVHGEKSAFFLGVGILIVGIYLIKDFNDAAERSRVENDRQWEMEQQRILDGSNHGENIGSVCVGLERVVNTKLEGVAIDVEAEVLILCVTLLYLTVAKTAQAGHERNLVAGCELRHKRIHIPCVPLQGYDIRAE